jgi:uncharacterized protein (DUF58 family)
LITQATKKFNTRWQGWARKRNRPGSPQTLNSRNVYILPSGFGCAYGLVILTLFSTAINYQISTIFLMTFLLFIIGMASAWEAQANLKDLSFKVISIEDAQQGTPAKVTLSIQANNKIRFGIEFNIASQAVSRVEKIPAEGMQITIPVETTNRGYFPLPPVVISSLFPFGIFRVWAYAYFKEHYYVYPQPVNPGFWPDFYLDQNSTKKYTLGDEELYDLKQVENPWKSPNLIAWKIAAKGQGWYLKTMNSNEVECWLFRICDLPEKNLELKLQHLSYWLQTAELNGQMYGLELAPSRTQFARGKEHLQHCLRQLALYER